MRYKYELIITDTETESTIYKLHGEVIAKTEEAAIDKTRKSINNSMKEKREP